MGLITDGGATVGYTAVRVKEGALGDDGTEMRFPGIGERGAFVMELAPLPHPGATFSISVNDEPILAGINLRTAAFSSF